MILKKYKENKQFKDIFTYVFNNPIKKLEIMIMHCSPAENINYKNAFIYQSPMYCKHEK